MPSARLEFALETVAQAGRITLEHFRKGVEFELKSDESPVTIADRAAERHIREAIAHAFPGDGILGEEEGLTEGTGGRWAIDPIDGTKSFVAGVPLYATLLAYEVDHVPVLGVCYFPALDEWVYAEQGCGTIWNGAPCRVSSQADLNRSILACGGLQSMARHSRLDGILRLGERCLATRTWCDAYGHALVATGRIEAMLDPVVSHWDIAAMAVIVREAGGTFTDFHGRDALAGEAISSNGIVLPALLEAFAQ